MPSLLRGEAQRRMVVVVGGGGGKGRGVELGYISNATLSPPKEYPNAYGLLKPRDVLSPFNCK